MPSETEDTIKETWDLLKEVKAIPSGFGLLVPLPNTKMYDYAIEKGIIKDEMEYLWQMAQRGNIEQIRSVLIVNLTKMPDEVLMKYFKDSHIELKKMLKKNYPLYSNIFYRYF